MNANNKNYSIRPLTKEEKAFAADLNNYNYLFFYMKQKRLDPEKWYDILIEPYLNAVKKYHEYESARQYAFATVLKNMLWTAVQKQLKMERASKRIPEDQLYSLDFVCQGDNPFAEYTTKALEDYWIDQNQKVEKIVLDKELLAEILIGLTEVQGKIFEMLLKGYSKKEIGKKLAFNYAMLNTEINVIKDITYRSIYEVV